MGLVVERTTVEAVRDEIGPLLAAHWHEIGQDKARMRLDPHWDGYMALEKAGALAVFAATSGADLVGYAVFFMQRHLHYRTVNVAINDLLYLMPGYREGMAGVRMISELERQLKEAGAQKVFFGVKAWHDFGPLLARRGYAPMETVWAKWVAD